MPERTGKVLAAGADLTGYALRLTFTDSSPYDTQTPGSPDGETKGGGSELTHEPSKGDGSTKDGSAPSSVQMTTPVASEGTFVVTIPEKPDASFVAEVLSPAGEVIRRQRLATSRTPDPWEITVEAVPRTALSKPGVVAANRLGRLSGRVVRRDGSPPAPNLQVVCWGRSSDEPSDRVVFSARTDREGYFLSPMPPGGFAHVHAAVAGGSASERVEVELLHGDWPNPLILVLDGRQAVENKNAGCACETLESVPRAPTQDELVTSPASFSSDVGTGGCVNFNMPNRVRPLVFRRATGCQGLCP